jgi:aminopeptidase N
VKKLIPSIITTSLLLAGCVSTANKQTTDYQQRAENSFLSMEQAAKRSERVSNVDYVLNFNLTGEKTFSASSLVNFQLNDASTPLTIDLDKATITQLIVNGKQIEPDYNQWFITIPAQYLVQGKNAIKVSFERLHSTNGEGLHRFEDPVDGKVYLYSHFEPAAAHQMFALFDQPDLKAHYQMTVSTPTDWQVISAMKETRSKVSNGKKIWEFDRTLKLSPYNFSLHAGPYKVFEDQTGKYPMRLLVRQSVAKQVNPADWFKYTKQGINFFENYYGVDYPFRKYDQILVPDFLYGAMENAAAITFAERGFLTNGEMNASQKQRLASVILHEMAHQWFGNLVTMKWWNSLWLNESFAAFMQTMATAEATEFTNAWRSFYAGGKQSAYTQDQRVTTHPIEVPVPSTANAFDNIDAITYSKGASTLNQLRHLLGEEVFRRGIHNYLTQNAYQNAQLDDFIGALADAAGRNLDAWKQQWLYKAGVNTITASYQCEQGVISQFSLMQTADKKFPTLREQRVQVALFNIDKNIVNLSSNTAVTYQGSVTEVNELIGQQCPDLVYPNYQDWGFVKVNLDQNSFTTAKNNLTNVADPLLRSMLWQSLWDSVRDGKLPLNEYLTIALANVEKETDYTILGQTIGQISRALGYLKQMYGLNHAYVKGVSAELEKLAWKNTIANANDKNKLRRWFAFYRSVATSEDGLKTLAAILSGAKKVKNLPMNQDLRWSIIKHLSRYQYANVDTLIAKELENDKSDTGEKSALYAKVVAPDANVKAKWLAKIQQQNSPLPFSKLRTAMSAMYPSEQNELAKLTAEQRIATLPAIDKAQGPVFMRSYAGMLIPANCDQQSVDRLANAIATQTELSAGTKRALLVQHQEDERCVMIKQKLTIK